MTAKKKKKGGGIFWKLLFLVALCVFCFSMYQLVNIYLGYKKGVDEYHAVAEATTVQSSEPLEVVEEKKDEEGNLIFTNYVPGDFHTKVADVHGSVGSHCLCTNKKCVTVGRLLFYELAADGSGCTALVGNRDRLS